MEKKSKGTSDDAPPWYAAGLRFECQPDCGACCTNHDVYSYVYLEGDDLPRLAAFHGLSDAEFADQYTQTEHGTRFIRMDTPDCVFLEGHRCGVYEARPSQCSTFPFWRENVASPRAWNRLTDFCPGIDRGERHPLHVIQEHFKERS